MQHMQGEGGTVPAHAGPDCMLACSSELPSCLVHISDGREDTIGTHTRRSCRAQEDSMWQEGGEQCVQGRGAGRRTSAVAKAGAAHLAGAEQLP
jgi:hypothetical protein